MITLRLEPDLYLQRLRAVGAWWRLGSSALEPRVLVEHAANQAVAATRIFGISSGALGVVMDPMPRLHGTVEFARFRSTNEHTPAGSPRP